MQRLQGLGCSKFGPRNGDHRLGSITINSTHGIKPLSTFISRNVLRLCCFTIHDMIYAALHVNCSVLLQMRHSGLDASELTRVFCIEPLYTVHQWLPLLGMIPMLVVADAPSLMLVNLSP